MNNNPMWHHNPDNSRRYDGMVPVSRNIRVWLASRRCQTKIECRSWKDWSIALALSLSPFMATTPAKFLISLQNHVAWSAGFVAGPAAARGTQVASKGLHRNCGNGAQSIPFHHMSLCFGRNLGYQGCLSAFVLCLFHSSAYHVV